MCGFLKQAASIAAPIVGFALGGPPGAALAGGLAGGITGGVKGAVLGGIGGYFGGGALASGGFIGGEGLGAFADSVPGAAANIGSNISSNIASAATNVGNFFTGAGESAPALYTAGAPDPIQLLDRLDQLGGGQGATAGAQSLGYDSAEAAVVNAANWAGPGFEGAQGGGGTPPASMGGMIDQLGNGVTPGDIGRAATSGLRGNSGGSVMSPWSLAQGAYGIYTSERLKSLAAQAARNADPNAPYRAGYAARLNALSQDPSSIFTTPGYAAGEQAVQRTMAGQGYTGSGNARIAMQKYGGDFYNQEMARLSALSGGNAGQVAAPQLNFEGNVAATNLMGQSINNIAYGASRKAPLSYSDYLRMTQ